MRTYPQRRSFLTRVASLGAALSIAGLAPAVAQTQQDCDNFERLVALALHGFPGMEGRKQFGDKDVALHELAKPVPGFKSCELWVQVSLSGGDPFVTCDIMKSANIEPVEGTQTPEMVQMWQDTMNSFAADMGRCLGVQFQFEPVKAEGGREAVRWSGRVERPKLSTSAYASLWLTLDQPRAGERLGRTNRIHAGLGAMRTVRKEVEASSSRQVPERVSVADFEVFAGLRRGAHKDEVLRLYGEPVSISSNESQTRHYYHYARNPPYGFTVGVDAVSGRVSGVALDSIDVADWMRRRGVNDLKMNLLSLHREGVIARLGKPQRVSLGLHHWKMDIGNVSLLLTMSCFFEYKEKEGYCTAMSVDWL